MKNYVITGNAMEYFKYLDENPDKRIYSVCVPIRGDVLRGLEKIHGVFYGTWYEREDISELLNFICATNKTTPRQIFGSQYESVRRILLEKAKLVLC